MEMGGGGTLGGERAVPASNGSCLSRLSVA